MLTIVPQSSDELHPTRAVVAKWLPSTGSKFGAGGISTKTLFSVNGRRHLILSNFSFPPFIFSIPCLLFLSTSFIRSNLVVILTSLV